MSAVPRTAVRVSLRVAATTAERNAAIDAWLASRPATEPPLRRLIVAEGALFDRSGPQGTPLVGLPAGCPCCTGWVTLRVTLARTLRGMRPEALLLVLMSGEHLPRLRRLLEGGELGVRFEVET